MRRDPITSTNLAEIGYDPTSRTLEVQFKTGAVYQYFDVPQQVYNELINASSIGGYLNANVKGHFRYART